MQTKLRALFCLPIAAALPPIAQQYLQIHAQRSDSIKRPDFGPSESWEEIEPLRLDDLDAKNDDEEGWIVLSDEQQICA